MLQLSVVWLGCCFEMHFKCILKYPGPTNSCNWATLAISIEILITYLFLADDVGQTICFDIGSNYIPYSMMLLNFIILVFSILLGWEGISVTGFMSAICKRFFSSCKLSVKTYFTFVLTIFRQNPDKNNTASSCYCHLLLLSN